MCTTYERCHGELYDMGNAAPQPNLRPNWEALGWRLGRVKLLAASAHLSQQTHVPRGNRTKNNSDRSTSLVVARRPARSLLCPMPLPLTVRRRFSVRGEGGGMSMAMLQRETRVLAGAITALVLPYSSLVLSLGVSLELASIPVRARKEKCANGKGL